ncbi:MAG: glycosyltransferase family 2 protein [Pseudomonadota bacterium]
MALPITAYIRTLNEARLIGAVVEAAARVADEVIVVDSGSTDETAAIAKAAGARVIAQPWLGNGYQKRVGENAARHDWLLDLDADEIVSARLAVSIAALFDGDGPNESVYALDLCLRPPGGPVWQRFFNVPRAKLYDRRQHRQPEHRAWDQLPDIDPARITLLAGPLIHHGHRDIAQVVEKMNRVSTVRALETRRRPMAEIVVRIVCLFPVYFWKQYVGKGGWRGGFYGFTLCTVLSLARWLRDVKMYEDRMGRRADQEDAGTAAADEG